MPMATQIIDMVGKITFSEYSTTSRIERGYPDIRYALAAGAIFISNINTSVTVFDDSCEKSCMSIKSNVYSTSFSKLTQR